MSHLELALIMLGQVLALAGLVLGVVRAVSAHLDRRFVLAEEMAGERLRLQQERTAALALRLDEGIAEHAEIRAHNATEHAEIRRSIETMRNDMMEREDWARTWGVLDWELGRMRRQLDDLANKLSDSDGPRPSS